MGAAAAVIIIRKEKDLVAHFQQAHAISAATAQSLSALRVDAGVALRRLRQRAVIREAAPGTFYLDEPSWVALRAIRRRMASVMLLIALALAVIAVLVGRSHAPP